MKNTRKILFVILSLALSFVLVFALVSCNEPAPEVNDGGGDPEIFTVTFDSAGGTAVSVQTVESGKKATEPTAPERAGYEFLGWYLGDEKWSFVGHVVTENITLTAKWETAVAPTPTKHTVTFDSAGGTSVASIEVETGKKATEPTAPERAGYEFLGWYLGDEKWSFVGYVVTEDMTLTAKWEIITYICTVNTLDGDETFEFTVESESIPFPTPLNTATKKFIGWRVGDSETLVSEFTLEKGTLGSIEITAVYKDVCLYHVDDNDNGICDECDEPLSDKDACEHDDVNGDGYCDVCGYEIPKPEFPEPLWESQTIIMQLNKCSNNSELSSELARYVAGDSSFNEPIDKAVSKRNIAATDATNVTVSYKYWDDDSAKNGWGDTIDHIDDMVNSTTIKDAPDVYSTYIHDLVGSSIKGYFANLLGTVRGLGSLKGLNYFEFVCDSEKYHEDLESGNDRGYMYEWMQSVTLDPANRMYVLASDYFVDMVRAAYVIPVNQALFEEIANENQDLTGDRNEDGVIDIRDLYLQVYRGEWTYNVLQAYASAAYIEDDNAATLDKWLGDTRVGFAMSDGGAANTGIIYSTSNRVIHKAWNTNKNAYDYFYPGSYMDPDGFEAGMAEFRDGFGKLVDAVEALLATDGVVYVKREYCQGRTWNDISHLSNNTEHQAIRVAFGQGSVLFGDIIMVGALEENEYQRMSEGSFGVLPVPIYHDNLYGDDRYLTQIHSTGRPGAIAYNTKKFVECTAFLNYQSTNSSKILNDYYTYNLCYYTAGGDPDTVEILEYVRDNIRNSFDKVMEDAMCIFDKDADDYRMTYLLSNNDFVNILEADYECCVDLKQGFLDTLIGYFKNAKD